MSYSVGWMGICISCVPDSEELNIKKVKQSRYKPWRRLGEEEIYLLLIHDLGTR
jgi:hypothetical protein